MTVMFPFNLCAAAIQLLKKNSRLILSFSLSLFLFLTVFQAILIRNAYAAPTTRKVPSQYATIQLAIDAARRGDIIEVSPGTYKEHVIVTQSDLLIKGLNKTTTIIDGDGTGTPISLEANAITVTGFTITNHGTSDYGIRTAEYEGHNISNNIITNMADGIYFSSSDSNIIYGNTFFNNSMHAINIGSSLNNQIYDNTISESAYGIYLIASNSTTVVRNLISETSFGIYAGYTTLNTISNNTEQSNSCGIQIGYSDHLTINNNAVTGSMYAIQLQRTRDSTLANNTFTQSSYGIYLAFSSYNTLGGTRGNLINKNDWGIIVYNATGNQIIDGNIIAENTWGISLLSYANGNTIYHNNFHYNVRHAYYEITSANNLWWNTNSLEGNYWNDYKGYPPAGGVDWYPLAQPWPMRNLAITSVTPSKTQFYPGEAITISVNVKNFGVITEIAKVTAYYGSNTIGTKTTTLAQNAAQLLTFNWNTANAPFGDHVISAKVEPLPYVERNYTDNTLTDGTVKVKSPIIGDISGPENPPGSGIYPPDGVVDGYDLIYLGANFGTNDPIADFTGPENPPGSGIYPPDGIVDGRDLILLGANFGNHI